MKIGIMDADLIGRNKHRFPNLVCEKMANYYRDQGNEVELVTSYNIEPYDEVYVSKVFTDTPFPDELLNSPKVHKGGTGFYFDKAPNLPPEIEHYFPDYHLYDDWIEEQIKNGVNKNQFKEYTDYAVGFITRGCFRKCPFCVNQKYDKVFFNANLSEFYDGTQKKICMLDDNFFGFSHWKEYLQQLIDIGKPFKFKQGLDERLLTDEKCELLFNAKYDGDFTFAFDNIKDYDLIHKKLIMIRNHTDVIRIKFYVLVGFESTDVTDIINAFKRIELLMKYKCLPYIMRYQSADNAPWKNSKFRGMYINLARWCNQPGFFKKKSFRQFCELNEELGSKASMRYLREFENEYPEIADRYFDIRFDRNGER